MTAPRKNTRRRNDGDGDMIPSGDLLSLAPLAPPTFAPVAQDFAPARLPRARVARAGRVARVVSAVKPHAATIDREHLMAVGANAAGGLAAALAAHEFADNLGPMPLAVTTSIAGGVGALLLGGNWQRVAQGMLGAGVGQIGVAYLAERGLKKQGKPAAPAEAPPAPPPGKRNAQLGDGTDHEWAVARALERAERRVAALLDDERERNAVGPYIDADSFEVYDYPVG